METQFPLLRLCDVPPGSTLLDEIDATTGLRLLVLRGELSFCGYIGLRHEGYTPEQLDSVHFPCHGGITFRGWGREGSIAGTDWYWWGWDYGHFNDVRDFGLPAHLLASVPPELQERFARLTSTLNDPGTGILRKRDWTVEEVCTDCRSTLQKAYAHMLKLSVLTKRLESE